MIQNLDLPLQVWFLICLLIGIFGSGATVLAFNFIRRIFR